MTIQNVTPEKFAAEKANLAKEATVDAGNSGNIQGHGVVVKFDYEPATEVLTVEVLHKPFYIPENVILGRIEAEFTPAAPQQLAP